MVIVKTDDGEKGDIAPLDLVAKSRVATTVVKICVMAYGNPETGHVRYACFKRMGPGSAIFVAASALLDDGHNIKEKSEEETTNMQQINNSNNNTDNIDIIAEDCLTFENPETFMERSYE